MLNPTGFELRSGNGGKRKREHWKTHKANGDGMLQDESHAETHEEMDEMGKPCNMQGTDEKCIRNSVRQPANIWESLGEIGLDLGSSAERPLVPNFSSKCVTTVFTSRIFCMEITIILGAHRISSYILTAHGIHHHCNTSLICLDHSLFSKSSPNGESKRHVPWTRNKKVTLGKATVIHKRGYII
jgi:hypothetical protein